MPEKEKRIMIIEDEHGTTNEVEVIFAFKFEDNKREYVVYTKYEKCEDGNIIIYVSNVDRSGQDGPKLLGVPDEHEWERIQEVIRELAKGNEYSDEGGDGEHDQQRRRDSILSEDDFYAPIPLSIMKYFRLLADNPADHHLLN